DYFVGLAGASGPAERELGFQVLVSLGASAPPQALEAAARTIEQAWAQPSAAASLLSALGRGRSEAYADKVRAHLADGGPEVRLAAEFAARELKLDASAAGPGTIAKLA